MYPLEGTCHCGKLRVEVALPQAPETFHPRACDCAFCRKHGAAYLSDPAGRMRVVAADAQAVSHYRQGSGRAEFLICRDCGVLVGVCCEADGRRYAAVNARVIGGAAKFAEETAVSPRKLDADSRVERWKGLWFREFVIETP
jgi:hypothetical protein